MNITEVFTPAAVAAYWTEVGSNRIAYLGEGLFPAQKKAGLDLNWFKGSRGLPVSLMPSAFDAKATFRDRIGVQKVETEMPFFREGFKLKEKDRQELLRAQSSADPYAREVLDRIFRDAADLIEGAAVVPERMRMQLLFPENGNVGISIVANGVNYTYNYDPDGSWRLANYTVLTGGDKWDAPSTADPVKTLDTARNNLRSLYGAESNVAIMNQATFDKMCACNAMKQRAFPGVNVANVYITGAEARRVLEESIGVTVTVYDKMYKDESKVTHKFVPDGYVSLVPARAIGGTYYGTTPEEADLMDSAIADVQIVNTGVAITREIQPHPVNVNTFASEIVLPSFEAMDECACIKVY